MKYTRDLKLEDIFENDIIPFLNEKYKDLMLIASVTYDSIYGNWTEYYMYEFDKVNQCYSSKSSGIYATRKIAKITNEDGITEIHPILLSEKKFWDFVEHHGLIEYNIVK